MYIYMPSPPTASRFLHIGDSFQLDATQLDWRLSFTAAMTT